MAALLSEKVPVSAACRGSDRGQRPISICSQTLNFSFRQPENGGNRTCFRGFQGRACGVHSARHPKSASPFPLERGDGETEALPGRGWRDGLLWVQLGSVGPHRVTAQRWAVTSAFSALTPSREHAFYFIFLLRILNADIFAGFPHSPFCPPPPLLPPLKMTF